MNDLMQFIDINPIVEKAKELDCPYIAIIGAKATGKTYGCVDYALRDYFKDNSKRPFIYLRRYDKTFTPSLCGNLVNSHRQDIINLSGGKYNKADLRGKIFSLYNETTMQTGLKQKRNVDIVGYCRSLNNIETETGDDKGEISCMIYDEFLTRGCELRDEFLKIQIAHSNGMRSRTGRFTPFFMLGNTVSKDSDVAEQFGIRMRDIKRGLNVFRNSKGQVRIILYYTDETQKNIESAQTYYDRFENSRINMITHGDWVLGSYKIAPREMLFKRGFTVKLYYNRTAVNATVFIQGYNTCLLVKHPSNNYDIAISPYTGKDNIQLLPKIIINAVVNGNLYVETSEIGEDFRDICKHIVNGQPIINAIE